MITVEIENKEYKLPTSWDDITLRMYDYIAEVHNNEFNTVIEKNISLLSKLMDCPEEVIRRITSDGFIQLANELSFINETPKKLPKTKVFKRKINNKEYRLVDLNKLTTGEMIDLELLIKDNNTNRIFADILAVIFREYKNGKIEQYNSDNNKDRIELFKDNLTLQDALTLSDFFLKSGILSSISMNPSSGKQKQKKKSKKKKKIKLTTSNQVK